MRSIWTRVVGSGYVKCAREVFVQLAGVPPLQYLARRDVKRSCQFDELHAILLSQADPAQVPSGGGEGSLETKPAGNVCEEAKSEGVKPQEILLQEQIKQEVKEEPLENSLPNSPESVGETPTDPLQIENSEIIPKVEEMKEEPKEESEIVEESKLNESASSGYPCAVCGRRFNQSGHLAIHMRMHTGERPYPCDLCSKAFKVKVERDDHRRTHTGERPFACTACPKTFTAAARLREHARIHTDQRPYKCGICGAAFRRPYARTVHTLIHTGEKPHECDICGTAFRRSGDMWKHKRTLHGTLSMNSDTN